MTTSQVAPRAHTLQRALCIIVVVVVVIAVIYAAWIGVDNFSRIGV